MSDRTNLGSHASAHQLDTRLKAVDEAKWLASRYAPAAGRRRLVALYLFDHELARATRVSEPMIARIRLQWWREALTAIKDGEVIARHEVLVELQEALTTTPGACHELFDLIDHWENVLTDQPERRESGNGLVAGIAATFLGPDIDPSVHRAVVTIATTSDRPTQVSLCRCLESRLWPAIAHLAAVDASGRRLSGLRARGQIFWAVLSRKL